MDKISKADLKSKYGLNLPAGKYYIEDTGKDFKVSTCKDDTDGCILLGLGKTNNTVTESRKAVTQFEKSLQKVMKKEKIFITIC